MAETPHEAGEEQRTVAFIESDVATLNGDTRLQESAPPLTGAALYEGGEADLVSLVFGVFT